MNKVYLDNASTTYPKPLEVADAVYDYMTNLGTNINRGCYEGAYSVEELVYDTRQLIADFFNAGDCKNVVFTKNVTESINLVLKGYLKPGDHILVSSMEHNAVMRPLNQLAESGITFSRIPCTDAGELCIDTLPSLVKTNTKAVLITHASNVCGTIMPLKEIGDFCKEHSLILMVDSAQTAGIIPIDMKAYNISALMFTGHKSLLGPQGIGGFILSTDLVNEITPVISGGTGSISHTEDIPSFMPDKFEAGTPNLPGILGLRAAVKWINDTGLATLYNHELELTNLLLGGLLQLEEAGLIKIIGLKKAEGRTSVVSIQALKADNAEIANLLDTNYGIMTRVGLHCAPNAHKTLGTYPSGTIRFSFGYKNTKEDVTYTLNALKEVLNGI